ncbi:MAG: hypothetical protein MUP44_07855, partial [Anaerolineales bacterium]|nr:hypothetical protein [Anaerolineales bacterium]
NIAAPAVGGITGAGIGITQGDTPEERWKNAAIGLGIGLGGGFAAGRGMRQMGRIPKGERVGTLLGTIEDIKPLDPNISNAKIRAQRFGNVVMRGTTMRKPFVEIERRVQARIDAGKDEARILGADARAKINANTNAKQRVAVEAKLQEVAQDISKVDELPEYLRPYANRMYAIRLKNAATLAARDSYTDATRETIAENGGNYLARSYAIFQLPDALAARKYRASLPKEDVEAALDAIQELWKPKPKSAAEQKLAADTIAMVANNKDAAVAVIKSLRPWMTDDNAAKIAAWVAAGKQTVDTPNNRLLRGLYEELINPSDMTRDEARVLFNEFMDRDTQKGFQMGRRQIGGKDVTSLYHKKEIDPRLRKVLGEIKDPISNIYHSIENQVGLIERDIQQRDFVRVGKVMGIMTDDADIAAQKGMVPFVESGTGLNSPYDNYDGVFVHPWLRDEFKGSVIKADETPRLLDMATKSIKTATGQFKWLKLIPAPDSRAVNLIGAWWSNGVNARGLNPAGKNVRTAVKSWLMGNGLMSPNGELKTQELLKLRELLIKHRILDQSVLGQDFIQNVRKSYAGDVLEKIDAHAQKEINSPALRKTYMAGKAWASGSEFAAG